MNLIDTAEYSGQYSEWMIQHFYLPEALRSFIVVLLLIFSIATLDEE
jgi:hypothetical protein